MQYPWLAHYPKSIPHTINPNEFQSLKEMFYKSVEKHSELTAFKNMGTDLSYQELHQKSLAFAAYLTQSLGLQKGDRIAIMMPNVLQYTVVLMGALCAGIVVVNVNPLYTPHELAHILNDSGAKCIVILANFVYVLETAMPQLTQLKHVIVTEIGDLFPFPKKQIYNFVVKYIKKLVKPWNLPKAIKFAKTLKAGKYLSLADVALNRDDLAFLQYTGGTTGVSKGTMLTHGNIMANILQMGAWLNSAKQHEGQDIVITPLPLYHIFSLTVNCLTFVMRGGQNVLITNPRDIYDFVKTLSQTPFTAISGVNTLYNALMNHPEFSKIDFSHLTFAIAGGMALQRAVAERWQQLTKTPLIEGYGLTEASPVVSANPLDVDTYTGGIGLPFPSTEVSIRDEEGHELPFDQTGELWARGPQIMKGYWNNPAETAKVLTSDGWLKTGDIAKMDQNGQFYIVDRKKDMIIVSGFNVYPNEVEDVIAKHPGVLEVAVIGIPDSQSGEKVKAFVVRRDPNVTEKMIQDFCHQYLTRYKVPHAVEFRDDLPKTNVGKILRRALREEIVN